MNQYSAHPNEYEKDGWYINRYTNTQETLRRDTVYDLMPEKKALKLASVLNEYAKYES